MLNMAYSLVVMFLVTILGGLLWEAVKWRQKSKTVEFTLSRSRAMKHRLRAELQLATVQVGIGDGGGGGDGTVGNVGEDGFGDRVAHLTPSELTQAYLRREFTAVAVVKAFIRRASEAHRRFNCLTGVCFEAALVQAEELDEHIRLHGTLCGPLHGVPVSVKDNISMRGQFAVLGLAKRTFLPQAEDALVIRLVREAGGIPFVRTNLPQTMLSFEASNPIFGNTLFPDLDHPLRSPGGSSSGEGCLIGAGASILGIGSDIAGSVRQPAHACGIYGFKPTMMRCGLRGCVSSMPGQKCAGTTYGPMSSSMDGIVTFCRAVMTAKNAKEGACVPMPFDECAFHRPGHMRIGFFVTDGYFDPSPACQRAVREAVSALQREGHEIVEFEPPNASECLQLYMAMMSADGLETMRDYLRDEVPDRSLDVLLRATALPIWPTAVRRLVGWWLRKRGWHRSAPLVQDACRKSVYELNRLQVRRGEAILRFVDRMNQLAVDAIVCPAHVLPAFRYQMSGKLVPTNAYSMLFNFLDLPAGVVPVTRVTSADVAEAHSAYRVQFPDDPVDAQAWEEMKDPSTVGLPVGVQVVARPFCEEQCLRAMNALSTILK